MISRVSLSCQHFDDVMDRQFCPEISVLINLVTYNFVLNIACEVHGKVEQRCSKQKFVSKGS